MDFTIYESVAIRVAVVKQIEEYKADLEKCGDERLATLLREEINFLETGLEKIN